MDGPYGHNAYRLGVAGQGGGDDGGGDGGASWLV